MAGCMGGWVGDITRCGAYSLPPASPLLPPSLLPHSLASLPLCCCRLNKARTSAESSAAKHLALVKVAETMKKNVEQEMGGVRAELARQEQVRVRGAGWVGRGGVWWGRWGAVGGR